MFAKKLVQKAINNHHGHNNARHLAPEDLDLQVVFHYGIPSTASILAFDTIQSLLAIGTLDGRIKVIGGDGIEGILISPNQLPYKYIEFLQNKGYLVGISNDNNIQVWNLEHRCLVCSLQWEANITAFAVISGSVFMYVGDENGLMSVMKYDAEDEKIAQLPYHISSNSMSEAAGYSFPDYQPIIGVLPQPHSSGNRVLIAYENGLLILWDVFEDRIIFVGGGSDLQLKDTSADALGQLSSSLPDDTSERHLVEKEISALCWASSNGSLLAIGYLDGDILFWNTSSAAKEGQQAGLSCPNVVKLQLSSAERRLPVIVLQWSKNKKSHNDVDGQLFIYGGDEIGSAEVLTVLNIEWSSGVETLQCVGRADLTLTGSFADIILLPDSGAAGLGHRAGMFALTNPGQLHFYDEASLSALMSQQERMPSVTSMEFPMVIPTSDPSLTVSKLSNVSTGGNLSKDLSEIATHLKLGSMLIPDGNAKWPVTGGVHSKLSMSGSNGIERLYLAGYQDGSVRIWDATYPVLSFICLLKSEVQGIKVVSSNAPASVLELCFFTLNLAVGSESGLVLLYNLRGCLQETTVHIVTESKHEVHNLPHKEGPQCRAALCLVNSPVRDLKFTDSGAKLAMGFHSGHIAVADTNTLSVLFLKDCGSGSSSPVVSIICKELPNAAILKSPKQLETKVLVDSVEEVLFILTKDAKVNIIDGGTGNTISSRSLLLEKESSVISMYVIEDSISAPGICNEKEPMHPVDKTDSKNEPKLDNNSAAIDSHNTEHLSSSEAAISGERSLESLILLCCESSLRLYSAKSVIQGKSKTIHKVKHENTCCWTTTIVKDDKVCGLALLYQTGTIEIRSLPDLELVKESSLMSILRWTFKPNMYKSMSSSLDGQITLVNNYEFASIWLLAGRNCLRIPESLPCLHDEVVAAAADAAFSFSFTQKKQKGAAPGILGSIVKGFKGGKSVHDEDLIAESTITHLESIFLKAPFSKKTPTTTNNHELVETSPVISDKQEIVELNIDDIEIDEPLPVVSTSSRKVKNKKKDKGTEREKLFEGASDDAQPRLRTREEIIAKYRKTGDPSSVAAQARDKLVERQEKLERISLRTEELKNGAEDFASLANELVKTMENRKWWHM